MLRSASETYLDGFGFVFMLLFGFADSEPVVNEEGASDSKKAMTDNHWDGKKKVSLLLLVLK
jgi:hypothetical protein